MVCDTTGNTVQQGYCYTCLKIGGYFGRLTKLQGSKCTGFLEQAVHLRKVLPSSKKTKSELLWAMLPLYPPTQNKTQFAQRISELFLYKLFRTSSTTTRDRNLQFRGAVSAGGSPLDLFAFSPVFMRNLVRQAPKNLEKVAKNPVEKIASNPVTSVAVMVFRPWIIPSRVVSSKEVGNSQKNYTNCSIKLCVLCLGIEI